MPRSLFDLVENSGELNSDPVVSEAMKRFQHCVEWESSWRARFLEDLKFANADSDNHYQWPSATLYAREQDRRPCLTMNIVRQHNLQIVNEGRQVKSSVAAVAVGNGATKESADVFQGLISRAEYLSDAQSAYTIGRKFQVDGGIGYWRITTAFSNAQSDEEKFNVEAYIEPVNDPLSIYLDPDIKQLTGSDARFGFVFDDVPRDQFEEAYPEIRIMLGDSPLGTGSGGSEWDNKTHIRVCEYFRKVPKTDEVISFLDPQTRKRKIARRSRMVPEAWDKLVIDPMSRTRKFDEDVVEWYLIVGQKRVDETVWPGKYIPLIRCVGEETRIEGMLDRKGHTRAMKDAQRMFNYNSSAQVEFVALQSKTPWVAPLEAIEGLEGYWNTANTKNHSILPFNEFGDDATQRISPPQRQQPPSAAPGFEQGMTTAFNQMMMVSGQWQNQMGQMGNERTGAAISKRQDQGDTATFHFRDNYETALVYTGRQLIDLFPRIMDTKRVLKIQGNDGADYDVEIDPSARAAFLQDINHQNEVVKRIFNPSVGSYDVRAVPGTAYGTRREETVQALTLILTQAPQLVPVIGDLLLRAMDFKESQEAAERLKRMVPAQALGNGPTAQEQQMQQQMQSLQTALAKALQTTAKDQMKLVGKDQLREIEVYKAETDRLRVILDDKNSSAEQKLGLIGQLMQQMHETNLEGIAKQDAGDGEGGSTAGGGPATSGDDEVPPVDGARKAPDGNWYISDQTRPGKYLRIKRNG